MKEANPPSLPYPPPSYSRRFERGREGRKIEIASAGFEEEDGHLTEVEVDEVLRLVRDVRAEVAAHDAVPSGIVLFVELLLDVAGDVFLDVVLLQRLSGTINGVLLHIFRHVGVFNHSLAVGHGEFREWARLRCSNAGKILKF